MNITLAKEFSFDAAHHLDALDVLPPDHKCRRMHGHTYRLIVTLTGEAPGGFLIDYAEIGDIVHKHVVSRVDHRTLNEIHGLSIPTTENLVEWAMYILLPLFAARSMFIESVGVRVYESSSTYCEATQPTAKRFFRCEDNGEHYDFVAVTLEHAKYILAHSGAETIADADKDFGTEKVEWTELAREQASMVRVNTDPGPGSDRGRIPLSLCEIGEWFTTCL